MDALRHDSGETSCALSVVVPCYNEEGNVESLHRRLSSAAKSVAGTDYEILLVNDGSKDGTWERIIAICEADRSVVGIDLSRNYGHQLALSAGLSICRGERILILDADLQDPPELLPNMYKLMDEGADVVFGQRAERLGETSFKKLTAKLFYRVLGYFVDIPIPFDMGDFRLMRRCVLNVLNNMPEHYRFVRGMVSWAGFHQVPILYTREPRHAGATKYSMSKMIMFAFDAITGFSIKPLRISSFFGVLFGLAGLMMLLHTFFAWVGGATVTGWTSLMSVVLVLGSAQLFVLGIIGEYLGRLFIEAKRRPLYVIKDVRRQTMRRESGMTEAA